MMSKAGRRFLVAYSLTLALLSLLCVVALMSGCGAYIDDGDDSTTSVYLNAPTELRPSLEDAVARLEQAGVRVGTIRFTEHAGTPVQWQPMVQYDGFTMVERSGKGVRFLHLDSLAPGVLLHELACHALTRMGDRAHLNEGLCDGNGTKADERIDARSLALVCEHVTCDWFSPE